ncbi:MAG: FecR domain-containing protein [Pseudomonadota bacterium]
MTGQFLCGAVFALVAAVGLLSGTVRADQAEHAGRVAEINRTGLQYHQDGVDYLSKGDPVIRNARLETDMLGEMALAMEDGTQLVMPPNSEIEIDAFVYDPDRTVGEAIISLGRGTLRMISGRLQSESYLVRTAVATIGVRGTDFTVELVPGVGLRVRVDEGAVEIRPAEARAVFSVTAGQDWICTATDCREVRSDDQPIRRASLGPSPVYGAAPIESRIRLAASADTGTPADPAGTSDCPPYRVPDRVYRQIGLDPANWPTRLEGIQIYRHQAHGVTSQIYCPNRIEMEASAAGFSVMGVSPSGRTMILYFINTLPGQAIFNAVSDMAGSARDEAAAYAAFMPRVFADQPAYQVIASTADMDRSVPGQLVLHQRADVRIPYGSYLVTGITLYRKVPNDRTALFAIPAVVTPDPAGSALSASDIARRYVRGFPDSVSSRERGK